MTDTRGLHSIDPDSNRMVSGAEYEAGPAPLREGWPEPIKTERLKGSASGFPPLVDPRSETGPTGESVIRARPKPSRDEMPKSMTWLTGDAV